MSAANAFMQRVADSYGSVGIIQTLVNVPGLIAGNVPSIEANPVNNNRSVAGSNTTSPGRCDSGCVGNWRNADTERVASRRKEERGAEHFILSYRTRRKHAASKPPIGSVKRIMEIRTGPREDRASMAQWFFQGSGKDGSL